MPTDNSAVELMLQNYGIDHTNDQSVDVFFETLPKRFSSKDIELIGEYLLAAESDVVDAESLIPQLPKQKAEFSAHALTKSDLVKKIATETDLSIQAAREAVNTILDSITNALHDGQTVRLTGFGTFSVVEKEKAAPKTKIVATPAPKRSSDLQFRAGKSLKDAISSRN